MSLPPPLFADDDLSAHRLLSVTIQKAGTTLLPAANGTHAPELWRTQLANLIVQSTCPNKKILLEAGKTG